MEELLTKYGVNLNDYVGEYDAVAFKCKACIEIAKSKPTQTFAIDTSRIKFIEVDEEDCDGVVIPLYSEIKI